MTKSDRANFGSKLGVILASAGSAVGLGNIWRFPFETGNHGGAAFILVYLVCVLILGIPIMIAEFLIGRRSRANTARAYQKLAPGTHWRWVGRMGVLAGFLILGYYSVVAGSGYQQFCREVGSRFHRILQQLCQQPLASGHLAGAVPAGHPSHHCQRSGKRY
mgnify:CR=1 FL=1